MISCKECATLNSIDSAFCKKCGKPLAQEEAIDAREELDKQLDHGFELFHHGRTDEAWLNVESCLLADPQNIRALSLKGLILERRGLILDAIECYESIVAKDPNAALERMKLQTLRALLDSRKAEDPAKHRRLALGIAVCTGLLVIAIVGAIVVSRSQPPAVVTTQDGKPKYTVDSFTSNDRAQALKQADQSDQQTSESSTQDQTASQKDNAQTSDAGRAKLGGPISGQLPNPANDSGQDAAGQFKPVNPLDHAEIKPIPSSADQAIASPTNNNVGGPANSAQTKDPDPSAVSPTDNQPPKRPAVVDIQLSHGQANDSDLAIDSNGVEAMVRTARGQYQVGNYEAAASTYERALSAGADPALTNQRLAQCYERLGRNSEAKDAYGKAITAIQNQINLGKGNKDRLMAALNSSQQALKNLQGG